MDLIDTYNGIGAEINKMTAEQLQNFCGVDFNNVDEEKLEDELLILLDKLIAKLKGKDPAKKLNAIYTLSFLIILFSHNDKLDGGDRDQVD